LKGVAASGEDGEGGGVEAAVGSEEPFSGQGAAGAAVVDGFAGDVGDGPASFLDEQVAGADVPVLEGQVVAEIEISFPARMPPAGGARPLPAATG